MRVAEELALGWLRYRYVLRFTVQRRPASDTNLFSADAADTALALSISSSAEMIESA